MENPIESSFTTKDFNLAAFLWSYKYPSGAAELDATTPTPEGDNRRVVLYFKFKIPLTKEQTESLVMQYLNGSCVVEPLAFINCQGKLKDIIHSRRV